MTNVQLTQRPGAKAFLRALAREATTEERRVLLDIASDFENRIALGTNPWVVSTTNGTGESADAGDRP
jgi:hypothetical protein